MVGSENEKIVLPPLNPSRFPNKEFYIKKRLKFANVDMRNIKGLIYDVYEFINMNDIPVDPTLFRLKDYLQQNFVGFLTEYNTKVVFRNVDHSHIMKHFKLKIQDSTFVDYYKLPGFNFNSKNIVLAEGIFDIFTANIFDYLDLKKNTKLYASVLSSKYQALIQSIVFHEQIFKPNITILSDRGIDLSYYKKMKKYYSHIIDSLTICYNKTGKDFNDTPVTPVYYVI